MRHTDRARDDREARLEAVRTAMAGIAHEVNNVLNTVLATAHLVRLDADDPALVREHAQRLEGAVARGTDLTARLGRFIRRHPVPAAEAHLVDIGALLQDVASSFVHAATGSGAPFGIVPASGGQAGRGIAVLVDAAPALCVSGDPGDLRVLFERVLDAVVAGRPVGDTVHMAAAAGLGTVTVQCGGAGGAVALEETGARPFEPFSHDDCPASAALGLAEASGIAARHGGSLAVAGDPARGVAIAVRLPRQGGS